jgi:hypothetical protein
VSPHGLGPGAPYETGAAPYPYDAGSPPLDERISGRAIASFVLGLLGGILLTAVLSVILGISALAEIRRSGRRGKGLAIAGIVLSCVWTVAVVGLFVLGLTPHRGSPSSGTGSSGSPGSSASSGSGGQTSNPASVSVFSLRVGTCFDNPANNTLGISSVTPIGCTQAHNAQVFAEFSAPGSSFPGTTALEQRADSDCNAMTASSLDKSKVTSTMSLHFIFPQQQAWDSGQRRVSCLIVDSKDMTSSIMAKP